MIPVAVDIALLDMVKCRLRLRCITSTDFSEQRSADLMPCKLEYATVYLGSKIDGVSISDLKIKVGCLQEDGCILLDLVQKDPNLRRAKCTEIGRTAKRFNVDVVGTAVYPLDCVW
jgi:hypothetical protein